LLDRRIFVGRLVPAFLSRHDKDDDRREELDEIDGLFVEKVGDQFGGDPGVVDVTLHDLIEVECLVLENFPHRR